jgi:hypothetical protein
MADIIRLEPHLKQNPAGAPRTDRPAAIVIFPGVRYERPADGGDATQAAGRRRRPRKAN